jgi:hypothetical protein
MTPEQQVADACRVVALRLEDSIERGRRSNQITANDLLEALLAIADLLEQQEPDQVVVGPLREHDLSLQHEKLAKRLDH